MSPRDALPRYYAERAGEYDAIYEKPERQADLARTARSVLATDLTDEVLERARARSLPSDTVSFARADAYRLDAMAGEFDAAFAGFWWSHVPGARLAGFLGGLHGRLARPARVLLMDNRCVEGSSTPLSRRDGAGDTYQQRRLADGTTYEVMKNFPSADEVRATVAAAGASAIEVGETTYYWLATYDLA